MSRPMSRVERGLTLVESILFGVLAVGILTWFSYGLSNSASPLLLVAGGLAALSCAMLCVSRAFSFRSGIVAAPAGPRPPDPLWYTVVRTILLLIGVGWGLLYLSTAWEPAILLCTIFLLAWQVFQHFGRRQIDRRVDASAQET